MYQRRCVSHRRIFRFCSEGVPKIGGGGAKNLGGVSDSVGSAAEKAAAGSGGTVPNGGIKGGEAPRKF